MGFPVAGTCGLGILGISLCLWFLLGLVVGYVNLDLSVLSGGLILIVVCFRVWVDVFCLVFVLVDYTDLFVCLRYLELIVYGWILDGGCYCILVFVGFLYV